MASYIQVHSTNTCCKSVNQRLLDNKIRTILTRINALNFASTINKITQKWTVEHFIVHSCKRTINFFA
jgi:tRNA A37 threonylcarbamoyladenosine dehydratase